MVRFKVVVPSSCKARCSQVSIPIWFDLKVSYSNGYDLSQDVSIPIWFDLKPQPLLSLHHQWHVSIPIWFDLKPITTLEVGLPQISFNSYMVRFKGSSHIISHTFELRFNSYMVRFKGENRVREYVNNL